MALLHLECTPILHWHQRPAPGPWHRTRSRGRILPDPPLYSHVSIRSVQYV